jgi:hypothetical protein
MVRTRPRPTAAYARVPALCPGGTVVCLGGGPSLHLDDVDYCRGKATVVAINDAWRLAPWADALIASDAAWWSYYKGVPAYTGLKFCLEASAAKWPGVQVLRNTGAEGLETEPTGVRTGRNTGAAAINLAVHFGASRVLLLGYDMEAKNERNSHWFGAHPIGLRGGSPYPLFRQMFATMVAPLRALDVQVINCSRHTALTCFPRQPLAEGLA